MPVRLRGVILAIKKTNPCGGQDDSNTNDRTATFLFIFPFLKILGFYY
jgi:hypothetical protein